MKAVSTAISVFLIPLMALMPLRAEAAAVPGVVSPNPEASVPSTPIPAESGALQIRVAEGGNSAAEVNSIVAGYSIVVTDTSGIPVSGAAVAIRLPEDAPTGYFEDGVHSAVAYTDVSGTAKFSKIHWSSKDGVVSVMITAVKGGLHAGAVIEQNLVEHLPADSQTQAELQKRADPKVAGAPEQTASTSPLPKQAGAASAPLAPGTPVSVSSIHSGATEDQPVVRPTQTSASADPAVSVVNSPGATGGSHGSKKWILLAVVAAGAGIGAAMALGMAGKGGSAAAASSSGVSIGAPSVSVGH